MQKQNTFTFNVKQQSQKQKQLKNSNLENNFPFSDKNFVIRTYKVFNDYSIQPIKKFQSMQYKQVPHIHRSIDYFLKPQNELNCSNNLSQLLIKQTQYQKQLINKVRKMIYKSHNIEDQNDFSNNCYIGQQEYIKIKDKMNINYQQHQKLQQKKKQYLLIYDILETIKQREKKKKILKQLEDLKEQKKKEEERIRKAVQARNQQSNQNNINKNFFQMSNQQLKLQKKYLLQKFIIQLKQHSIKKLKKIQNQLIAQLNKKKQKLMKISLIKKAANNELQQTRGNVRVYCRIRPCFNNNVQKINYEITDSSLTINKFNNNNIYKKQQIQKYQYIFQKIFDENATQAHIFDQMMDLIQNVLDGKNVCIFAYGQTGSGKTYTMNGGRYEQQSFKESMGIIPRSLKKIFHQIKQLNEHQQTEVQLSIFQIYNQNINDLLHSYHSQKNQKNKSKKGIQKYTWQKKQIFSKKLLDKKQIFQLKVQSYDDAMKLFYSAMDKRSTAETLSNSKSSRSHLIFQINLQLRFKQETRCSNLVLVDLAGSQRIKTSNVVGDRFKQANFINNSLTQLGKMMREIKSNNNHISFRNCVLTKILQQYLQEDGKAVMFVNVSPQLKDQQITLTSLKFASDVKDCKVGNNNGNNNKNVQTSNNNLNYPYQL